MSLWKVGDRVRNRPDAAAVYEGTEWAEKMAIPREGTVVEVTKYLETSGEGTIRIEWDSLNGTKADPETWRVWTHTSLVARIE